MRLWRWYRHKRFNVNYFTGYHEGWEACADAALRRLAEEKYLTEAQYLEVLGRWGV